MWLFTETKTTWPRVEELILYTMTVSTQYTLIAFIFNQFKFIFKTHSGNIYPWPKVEQAGAEEGNTREGTINIATTQLNLALFS